MADVGYPRSRRRFIALMITALLAFPLSINPTQGQDSCGDILRDGVLRRARSVTDLYDRWSLVYQLAQITKGEADRKIGLSGNAVIEGLPVGAAYKEADYNAWASRVREQRDYESVSRHRWETSILTGDPAIIGAWETCMLRDQPLKFYLKRYDGEKINLVIEWFPQENASGMLKITSRSIEGATFANPGDAARLREEASITRPGMVIPLERLPGQNIRVVINTDFRPIDLYLPYLSQSPPKPTPPKREPFWVRTYGDGTNFHRAAKCPEGSTYVGGTGGCNCSPAGLISSTIDPLGRLLCKCSGAPGVRTPSASVQCQPL